MKRLVVALALVLTACGPDLSQYRSPKVDRPSPGPREWDYYSVPDDYSVPEDEDAYDGGITDPRWDDLIGDMYERDKALEAEARESMRVPGVRKAPGPLLGE